MAGEKEARNPRIAAAFRRLTLCEQAGTGKGRQIIKGLSETDEN